MVFVIQDNGWAISTPSQEQTAGSSIAQMASGYSGLKVFSADGADFLKTKAVFKEAFSKPEKRAIPRSWSLKCHVLALIPVQMMHVNTVMKKWKQLNKKKIPFYT